MVACTLTHSFSGILFASFHLQGNPTNWMSAARQVMAKLYALFELIDTLGDDCKNALAVNNNDYEDAIMIESSKRAGVDCIVTRNPEHFGVSPVPVYSPDQFVELLNGHNH